ncbi:MAG: IS5 family transposase [Nitrososphaerales archaeon]
MPDKKPKKYRNWKEYNEALVRRGELLFNTDFLAGWRSELEKMNHDKEGARFAYPNSFLNMLAAIHAYLLPYRQLEGFVRLFSHHVKQLKGNAPDFTTIHWRASKMEIDLDPKVNLNEDITIAVDSTGIKVTNRGEWIKEKWLKERRGFIKMHVAVDTKSKQIVSMKVTQEDTGDGKMLEPLVKEASKKASIRKLIGDGGYDSKDNFKMLFDRGIESVIKVRSNSFATGKCIPRDKSVLEQLSDYRKWKKKHGYGMRWMAESSFSSIKRTFGESIKSVKWKNIVNELLLKASIYNTFMRMNP